MFISQLLLCNKLIKSQGIGLLYKYIINKCIIYFLLMCLWANWGSSSSSWCQVQVCCSCLIVGPRLKRYLGNILLTVDC